MDFKNHKRGGGADARSDSRLHVQQGARTAQTAPAKRL